MKIKRKAVVLTAFIFFFLMFVPSEASAAKTKKRKKGPYQVSAKSVIFSDSTNVKRLYGKDVHKRVQPASTTKVMTALLVLENLSMDQIITVPKAAIHAQPSKIYLKPGEKYKTGDLLYAILLNSANDASVVLAHAVSGSEAAFVHLMNQRARELGCRNTKFANSNGLPSKTSQYSSAYDMYLIFKAALKHSFFKKAISHKYKTIHSQSGRKIALKSHNKMLFQDWGKNIYGKTGYTRAAKACFVGYINKGKNVLIIGVFGCSRRWDDIKFIINKYGGVSL